MPKGMGYNNDKPKGSCVTVKRESVTIMKPEQRNEAIKRKLSHIFPGGK